MATSMPIRIDDELYASAKAVGAEMSRSATQQVAHWARLGRELEIGGSVSQREISRVLAGKVRYDDLGPTSQAVVRAAWAEGIAEDIAHLDLAAEFEAAGIPYAELDASGSPVVRRAKRDAGRRQTPASSA